MENNFILKLLISFFNRIFYWMKILGWHLFPFCLLKLSFHSLLAFNVFCKDPAVHLTVSPLTVIPSFFIASLTFLFLSLGYSSFTMMYVPGCNFSSFFNFQSNFYYISLSLRYFSFLYSYICLNLDNFSTHHLFNYLILLLCLVLTLEYIY